MDNAFQKVLGGEERRSKVIQGQDYNITLSDLFPNKDPDTVSELVRKYYISAKTVIHEYPAPVPSQSDLSEANNNAESPRAIGAKSV